MARIAESGERATGAFDIQPYWGRIYGQKSSEEKDGEEKGRQAQIRQEDDKAEGCETQGSATAQRQAEGRQEEGCQEEDSRQKGDGQEGGREKGGGAQARTGPQAGARTGAQARHGSAETGTCAGPVADESQPGRAQAGDVLGLGAGAQAGSRQAPVRGRREDDRVE
jgi:hypothetical protein